MRNLLKLFFVFVALTLGAFAFNYNSFWVNENRDSRGVTKLVINNNGIIDAFIACQQRDCSWGKARYTRTANGLIASWIERGRGHKVVLVESIRGDKIKVITKFLYCNGRDDMTKVEYFNKINRESDRYRHFMGTWINSDQRTRGVTRLKISKSGRQIYVHAWGSYQRGECDKGSNIATRSNNGLTVRWNQNNKNKLFRIEGIDRNHRGEFQTLKVTVSSQYNNSRGSQPRTYFLRRSRR